jgi:hypothetical protein
MRTKKTRRELEAVRVRAVAPLTWTPTPAWFIGGDVDILLPVEDVDLTVITKAEYLAALTAAVEDRELGRDYLEADRAALSWARVVAWREGDHGPHIDAAKQPVAKQQPTAPTGERYGNEGGVNRRASLETPEPDDPYEAERQRFLRIAQAAPVKYFT